MTTEKMSVEQALEKVEDFLDDQHWSPLMSEAREALATLRAEIAGLRADAERWRHYIKELRAGIVTALSREVPVKVSEPKMPALPGDGPYDPSDMHEYAQAYAAGIRAEVLGEVRAKVPDAKVWRIDPINAGYNMARDDFLAALATLENPNE